MPISIQKQLHQEGRFPYYRLGGRNKWRTGAPSDGSGWRPSMVPKMGSSGSLAAADGLSHPLMLLRDEGIYLIIFYGRTSLDG